MPDGQDFALPIRTELMQSQPGLGRDGTQLVQRAYIDAQWCRWYQGLPRKMLGFTEKSRATNGIVRVIDTFSSDAKTYIHLGSGHAIQRMVMDNITGTNSTLIDRTPSPFVPSDDYGWQFSQYFYTPTGTTMLAAALLPSAKFLTSSAVYPVYLGDILATSPFVTIPDLDPTAPPGSVMGTSGGCCVSGGYLFLYGHDGYVQWPAPYTLDYSDTTNGAGDARPVPDKIIRGLPMRGQLVPGVILWSLSSVILGQYVGPPQEWSFTTITTNGSVLSANAFVEHNGIFYWPTTSGFSMFNGVVRDLPNQDNRQWFFDNLNWPQRIKIFGFKVPRWDEIWWCFPKGNSTECNWALIYNYALQRWYDTPLPNDGRSAGTYEFIYAFPLMTGVEPHDDTGGGFSVWQHEIGFDEVSGQRPGPKAIRSFYRTNEFSLVEPKQLGQFGIDQAVSYSLLEPDFDQTGELTFTTISRANARSKRTTIAGPFVIPEVAADGEQLVKFQHTGRLTSFQIESNTLGGNYIHGSPLIHMQPGDGRRED